MSETKAELFIHPKEKVLERLAIWSQQRDLVIASRPVLLEEAKGDEAKVKREFSKLSRGCAYLAGQGLRLDDYPELLSITKANCGSEYVPGCFFEGLNDPTLYLRWIRTERGMMRVGKKRSLNAIKITAAGGLPSDVPLDCTSTTEATLLEKVAYFIEVAYA